MANYIGIDLGGTNLRGAFFEESRLLDRAERPTVAERGPEAVLEDVIGLVRELGGDKEVEAVALGMPGVVNGSEGTVRIPPNLPGWDRVDVRTPVEKALNLTTYFENDANLFALGEWALGAGKGYRDIVALTLGTGVGGGIISGGRLVRGSQCAGAEIGHSTIDLDGPLCHCGNIGCIESFVGGAYFNERARDALNPGIDSSLSDLTKITPKDAYEAAKGGDPGAMSIWKRYGFYVGIGVVNVLHIFAPEVIILGGQISKALEFFRESLEETVYDRWMGFDGRNFRLKQAELGDDSALYGAQVLASRRGDV
jgi:glucokinase